MSALSGDIVKLIDSTDDGKTITLEQWAEDNLDSDDYFKFLQANSRNSALFERAQFDGIVTVEPVIELLYSRMLNVNVPYQVGVKIKVKEGHTIPLDPVWLEFEARFSNSDKIVYRPVEPSSENN